MSNFRGGRIYTESLRADPGQEVVNIFLNNLPPPQHTHTHTACNGSLCSDALRVGSFISYLLSPPSDSKQLHFGSILYL